MGRVRTPSFYCSARRLMHMPGNSAIASLWIMFSTEPRLDPDSALPHQTVCWALSRLSIRGEDLIDRRRAVRVWPSHVFGYSLFTSATSRQWNVGSPVFIWKHPCTVPCISQALYIKIIALRMKCYCASSLAPRIAGTRIYGYLLRAVLKTNILSACKNHYIPW